jgi:hypothetical protein
MIFGVLMSFASLAGAIWLAVSAFRWFGKVSPNVGAALVTAIAALIGVFITQRANKAKEVAEAHRVAKVEVYRRFMNFVTAVLTTKRGGSIIPLEERLGPDFEREFTQFTSEIVVWGSPEVLRKFAAWRLAAEKPMPEPLLAVDDLLQAIRVDLLNSNRSLKRGDLIRLYLRDPTELDSSEQSTSGLGMTATDEAAPFLAAYGPPEDEKSAESENPRPPLITRLLIYRPENVRVVLIADEPIGTTSRVRRWKLLGFQDDTTDTPMDVTRVAELLAERRRRVENPARPNSP